MRSITHKITFLRSGLFLHFLFLFNHRHNNVNHRFIGVGEDAHAVFFAENQLYALVDIGKPDVFCFLYFFRFKPFFQFCKLFVRYLRPVVRNGKDKPVVHHRRGHPYHTGLVAKAFYAVLYSVFDNRLQNKLDGFAVKRFGRNVIFDNKLFGIFYLFYFQIFFCILLC